MSEPAAPDLVILDRDGVINFDSDDYIKTVEEWQPIPGSIEAIAALSKAGYRIAVATNQSGLGRGYFSEFTLANMHNLLLDLVEEAGGSIETIVFCPHKPDEGCACRKPETGLIDQIEAELNLSSAGAWYVGDAAKDMELAGRKSCKGVLVRTGKGRETESRLEADMKNAILGVDDLAEAARAIINADGKVASKS
jgi:D-glycero-D-manno-heptose 1,7-bisphosphate phosphatase